MPTTPVTIQFANANLTTSQLTIDATVSEGHSLDAEVTDHPVEKDSDITDHIRPKPKVLKLSGIISDAPITQDPELQSFAASSSLSRFAFEVFEQLQLDGTLCVITTKLKVYDECVVQTLTVNRDSSTGDVLSFDATFRQIRIVTTQTVKVIPAGKSKTDLGPKPTKPADDATKNQSVLDQIFHWGVKKASGGQ